MIAGVGLHLAIKPLMYSGRFYPFLIVCHFDWLLFTIKLRWNYSVLQFQLIQSSLLMFSKDLIVRGNISDRKIRSFYNTWKLIL